MNNLSEKALELTNAFWPLNRQIELDDSGRIYLYKKIEFYLSYTNKLDIDFTFLNEIYKNIQMGLTNYYNEFGGKIAFLIYCLQRSLEQLPPETKIKITSLLNWYHGKRKTEYSLLTNTLMGGSIDFNIMFQLLFDYLKELYSILNSILIVYEIGKNIDDIIEQIKKLLKKISDEKPYLLKKLFDTNSRLNITLPEFKEHLEKIGITEQYFAILEINSSELKFFLKTIVKESIQLYNTLSEAESKLLTNTLKFDKSIIQLQSPTIIEKYQSLRKKQLVKFVELKPGKCFAIIFPFNITD